MTGRLTNDQCSENDRLRAENDALRLRLEDAEQAIEAIRTGQVESLVGEGPNGPSIYSREGADHSYRVLVEAMNEGAATVSDKGAILYCNARFAEMLEAPLERVMGGAIQQYMPQRAQLVFDALARDANSGQSRGQLELLCQNGRELPVQLSVSVIHDESSRRLCLVATDLRLQKHNENIVASERLARSVIEQSVEAIIVCDETTRIIRASSAAERLCGANPLLRMFDEVFAIEIATHAEEHTNRLQYHESGFAHAVLRGAVACVAPATLVRPDGITADLLVSANALHAEGGGVKGCVINLVDVTELNHTQKQLSQSETRLRSVLENSLDACYRRDLKRDRFDFLGPAIQTLTGFSVDEMASMSSGELLSRTHPDDLAGMTSSLDEAAIAGELKVEYRFRHKDGNYRYLADRAAMIRDESGRVRFRTGIIRDVTERKRIERLYAVLIQANEAITRARDKQTLLHDVCRIVVEQGEFPVVWIGLVNGQNVTPAVKFGPKVAYVAEIKVEVDGELGQGPTGTCIRENRPVLNADFGVNPSTAPWRESALRFGIRASAAFPLHKGNETIGAFTLYAEHAGAFDAGQVKLLEALCADISYALAAQEHERKRAETEAALREADQRKNDFLASLSHELRNPLAPIKNSLYILGRVQPGSDRAKNSLAVIDRQAAQLGRLVDDLLDVTRITRNKIHLQRSRLDLNELVRAAVEDQRSVFANAGVGLVLVPESDPQYVNADSNRLAQVVGNLLQNAAKFTGRDGTTRVTIHKDSAQNQARIEITDSGVGMAADMLARLFEPFMQADQTLDRSQGGLGLGLALVKGLVELHGGTVAARSAGLGKGATFEVRLPLVDNQNIVTPPAEKATTRRRRILVIEDNIDAADTLHMALEYCGHEVAVAYDGPDGLARAREFQPEIVLCDIGLPGMDGYQVARELRSDDSLKNPYIVALSGYALPEDRARAEQAGFDQHLAKPPSLERIAELLISLPAVP